MSGRTDPALRIGTAGWSIPARYAQNFPGPGPHLQRYAARFAAAEINSSFHRPHRPATYARWAATVPEAFRFAVKLPREITHKRKLADAAAPLDQFLGEIGSLGKRLGPLLIQLPPSFRSDTATASAFFDLLRARTEGEVACEPRHASWFGAEVDAMLSRYEIARVAADPAPVPSGERPGGWPGLVYYRLHGSPRTYYSGYEPSWLDQLAMDIAGHNVPVWCMFDNTASGAAAGDALNLVRRLGTYRPTQPG